MTRYRAWLRGLPTWLKLVYFVAICAWLFAMGCIVTGQRHSPAAGWAAALFLAATVLLHLFDRREGEDGHEADGVSFGDSDS